MTDKMKRIVLARRPTGAPVDEDFRLEEAPLPTPGAGEVLVRVTNLSLDPYMRGRMDDAPSYAKPVDIGGTMEGGAVGEVIASEAEGFSPGDKVFGMFGWATHGVANAKTLRKLPDGVPETTALGVLGMPGFTGWHGLTAIGQPKEGETLVVAAATGPVGSMVGQLAKRRGLRTVAVAGGAEKCRLATEKFGFDATIDHKAHADAKSIRAALSEAAPNGVDIYFENVGGPVTEAVMPVMNVHGRVPVCGMIAWYDGGSDTAKDRLPRMWRTILTKRLHVQGFIIMDHWDRYAAFLKEVAPLVASGEIAYIEDVAEGLENAPRAFMSMLKGGNLGKQVVRIG